MFCAGLRKRPEWAAVVPLLLKKEIRGWKGTSRLVFSAIPRIMLRSAAEKKLETHDIAMPMPGVGTIDGGGIFLRFILLSALDVKRPDTMQRIERLFYLEGGRRCALAFLLSTNGDEDGLSALGRLQVEYARLLPLDSIVRTDGVSGLRRNSSASPSYRSPPWTSFRQDWNHFATNFLPRSLHKLRLSA